MVTVFAMTEPVLFVKVDVTPKHEHPGGLGVLEIILGDVVLAVA